MSTELSEPISDEELTEWLAICEAAPSSISEAVDLTKPCPVCSYHWNLDVRQGDEHNIHCPNNPANFHLQTWRRGDSNPLLAALPRVIRALQEERLVCQHAEQAEQRILDRTNELIQETLKMRAELESERTKIELLRARLAEKDIEASTCAGCLKSAEEDCVGLQAEEEKPVAYLPCANCGQDDGLNRSRICLKCGYVRKVKNTTSPLPES